jgi:hypothetical protein
VNPWPPWKWAFKIAFALLFPASVAITLGPIAAVIVLAVYVGLAGYQFKRDKEYSEGKREKPWPWWEPPR